jgi:hypothetical protein
MVWSVAKTKAANYHDGTHELEGQKCQTGNDGGVQKVLATWKGMLLEVGDGGVQYMGTHDHLSHSWSRRLSGPSGVWPMVGPW